MIFLIPATGPIFHLHLAINSSHSALLRSSPGFTCLLSSLESRPGCLSYASESIVPCPLGSPCASLTCPSSAPEALPLKMGPSFLPRLTPLPALGPLLSVLVCDLAPSTTLFSTYMFFLQLVAFSAKTNFKNGLNAPSHCRLFSTLLLPQTVAVSLLLLLPKFFRRYSALVFSTCCQSLLYVRRKLSTKARTDSIKKGWSGK